MGKLTLAVGFAAGYVLGAKAGKERYEQIMGKAREVAGRPEVQDAAHRVQETATAAAGAAKDKANETVQKVSDKADEAGASAKGSSGPTSGSPSSTASATTPAPAAGAAASDTV